MKKNIKKLLLLIVTVIFLYFVFLNLDIRELIVKMKEFNPLYAFFLVCSIVCSFICRSVSFKYLMSNTVKLNVKELVPLCLTGASLNIVLPARAGDIFRAFFIGQKYNISKMKVFGTVILERMFDTFVIFCLLLIAISFYHKTPLASQLCCFAGISMFAFALFAFFSYKYNKTDAICAFLTRLTANFPFAEQIHKLINFTNNTCNSFFNGFEVIATPSKLPVVIAMSFGIWTFECLNYYIMILGFGLDIHWSVTLFIMCFIALACMVPSTSIFIGPYQMAVIAAFAIYGVAKETALAISFVEQAIVVITTSVVAVIFLIQNNISYKELKEDIEQNEE